MYLHVGRGKIIPFSSIIGIFDLEMTSQSKRTRLFLSKKERANHVINVCEDIPRSFVVCREENKERVYISQLSSQTLYKRAEAGFYENNDNLNTEEKDICQKS